MFNIKDFVNNKLSENSRTINNLENKIKIIEESLQNHQNQINVLIREIV